MPDRSSPNLLKNRLPVSRKGKWFEKAAMRLRLHVAKKLGRITVWELRKVHPEFAGLGVELAETSGLLSEAGCRYDRNDGGYIALGKQAPSRKSAAAMRTPGEEKAKAAKYAPDILRFGRYVKEAGAVTLQQVRVEGFTASESLLRRHAATLGHFVKNFASTVYFVSADPAFGWGQVLFTRAVLNYGRLHALCLVRMIAEGSDLPERAKEFIDAHQSVLGRLGLVDKDVRLTALAETVMDAIDPRLIEGIVKDAEAGLMLPGDRLVHQALMAPDWYGAALDRIGMDLAPPVHGPTQPLAELASAVAALCGGRASRERIVQLTAIPVTRADGVLAQLAAHGVVANAGDGFDLVAASEWEDLSAETLLSWALMHIEQDFPVPGHFPQMAAMSGLTQKELRKDFQLAVERGYFLLEDGSASISAFGTAALARLISRSSTDALKRAEGMSCSWASRYTEDGRPFAFEMLDLPMSDSSFPCPLLPRDRRSFKARMQPEINSACSLADLIVAELATGPMTADDLAAALGEEFDPVHRTLGELISSGTAIDASVGASARSKKWNAFRSFIADELAKGHSLMVRQFAILHGFDQAETHVAFRQLESEGLAVSDWGGRRFTYCAGTLSVAA